jgi:hypothetical protein
VSSNFDRSISESRIDRICFKESMTALLPFGITRDEWIVQRKERSHHKHHFTFLLEKIQVAEENASIGS